MRDPIWDSDRPPEQRAASEQVLLNACGHPFRRDLLVLLRIAPRAGKELVALLGASPQHVSRELHILNQAGLVSYEREGTFHLYQLTSFITVEIVTADVATLDAKAANGRKVWVEFQVPSTHVKTIKPVINQWLKSPRPRPTGLSGPRPPEQ